MTASEEGPFPSSPGDGEKKVENTWVLLVIRGHRQSGKGKEAQLMMRGHRERRRKVQLMMRGHRKRRREAQLAMKRRKKIHLIMWKRGIHLMMRGHRKGR